MPRELLFSVTKKDLKIDTFRAGGKGGQHQNKTESGVRITHIDSGAVGESRDGKSQTQNKRKAFLRMMEHPKWRIWFNLRVAEATERESIEHKVDRMMRDIDVEYRENGKWVSVAKN